MSSGSEATIARSFAGPRRCSQTPACPRRAPTPSCWSGTQSGSRVPSSRSSAIGGDGRGAGEHGHAHRPPGHPRAAPVRARRMGFPAADADCRPAGPRAAARDRGRGRRCLELLAGRERRASSTSVPAPERSRWRSPTSTQARAWSASTPPWTALALAHENVAAPDCGRAPAARPLRRPPGGAVGPRRLQPAVRRAGRARRARAGRARLGAARGACRHGSDGGGGRGGPATCSSPAARSCSRSATGRRRAWRALLAELGYRDVRVTPDLAGRDRVVEGRRVSDTVERAVEALRAARSSSSHRHRLRPGGGAGTRRSRCGGSTPSSGRTAVAADGARRCLCRPRSRARARACGRARRWRGRSCPGRTRSCCRTPPAATPGSAASARMRSEYAYRCSRARPESCSKRPEP